MISGKGKKNSNNNMIAAEDTEEMKKWEELIEKHKAHWQFYKDMLNFSLQKSANSPITSMLYPWFYQERLLKQRFVENMQFLGDFTDNEFDEYEDIRGHYLYRNMYNYYKEPGRGWMKVYHISIIVTAGAVGREVYRGRRPKQWWIFAPLGFIFGVTAVLQRILILNFGNLINMSHWAIEKRKAEVWQAQSRIQVPPLQPLLMLTGYISDVVIDQKSEDNT